MSEQRTLDKVLQELTAPFEPGEVKWKPSVVSGNRALALAYVDARVIMDRLDDVLGAVNWEDRYEFLPDGSCLCTLRLRLGGEWIVKMDVGGESEQKDEGDRRKAAVSDALKRAAVKFGIGRFLYRLPAQWMDYDPLKKQFIGTPKLPASLYGKPAAKPAAKAKPSPALPKDGKELLERLTAYEMKLVNKGVCEAGALISEVEAEGRQRGFSPHIVEWGLAGIEFATEFVRDFEARRKQAMAR